MRILLSFALACSLALPLTAQEPASSITLTSFNAVARDKQVLLSWNPEQPGVQLYELEKSKNGSEFTAFGKVQGADANMEFIETDFMPYEGLSWYRLKLTDANGNISYSNVVPVKYDGGGNPISPVPSQANTNGFRDKSVLIIVRSAGGDEFYSKVEVDAAGDPIQCNNPDPLLSRGIYTIVGCSEQELYAKQIVVK